MNCRRIYRTDASGFTLIELVVGLTLWVVVAMSLMRVFQGGLRLWKSGQEAAPIQQEARVILGGMAREFRNSIDVPGTFDDQRGREFTWATVSHGTIEKVTYRLVPPQMSLHRFQQELSWAGSHEVVDMSMTAGPASLFWEYAYASRQGGVLWKEDWKPSDPQARPCGLRVCLTLFDKHGAPESYTRTMFIPTSVSLPWPS